MIFMNYCHTHSKVLGMNLFAYDVGCYQQHDYKLLVHALSDSGKGKTRMDEV